MSNSNNNDGGIDVLTLESPSLYRWLDQQDDGWRELPEEYEFTRPDVCAPKKRLAKLRRKLRSVFRKPKIYARRYAYQPV